MCTQNGKDVNHCYFSEVALWKTCLAMHLINQRIPCRFDHRGIQVHEVLFHFVPEARTHHQRIAGHAQFWGSLDDEVARVNRPALALTAFGAAELDVARGI